MSEGPARHASPIPGPTTAVDDGDSSVPRSSTTATPAEATAPCDEGDRSDDTEQVSSGATDQGASHAQVLTASAAQNTPSAKELRRQAVARKHLLEQHDHMQRLVVARASNTSTPPHLTPAQKAQYDRDCKQAAEMQAEVCSPARGTRLCAVLLTATGGNSTVS